MRTVRFKLCCVSMLMLVVACLATNALAADRQPARWALVIGNTNYTGKPLLNPANDARAMSHVLTGLGFEVQEVLELKATEIGGLLDGFVEQITAGDTVVVYYAGHGVQIRGINYLIATDANFHTQHDLMSASINVTSLLNRIDESRRVSKFCFWTPVVTTPTCRVHALLPPAKAWQKWVTQRQAAP